MSHDVFDQNKRRTKLAQLFSNLSDTLGCGLRDRASLLEFAIAECRKSRLKKQRNPDDPEEPEAKIPMAQPVSKKNKGSRPSAASSLPSYELLFDLTMEPSDPLTIFDLEKGSVACNAMFAKTYVPTLANKAQRRGPSTLPLGADAQSTLRGLVHVDDWPELVKSLGGLQSFHNIVRLRRDPLNSSSIQIAAGNSNEWSGIQAPPDPPHVSPHEESHIPVHVDGNPVTVQGEVKYIILVWTAPPQQVQ